MRGIRINQRGRLGFIRIFMCEERGGGHPTKYLVWIT